MRGKLKCLEKAALPGLNMEHFSSPWVCIRRVDSISPSSHGYGSVMQVDALVPLLGVMVLLLI